MYTSMADTDEVIDDALGASIGCFQASRLGGKENRHERVLPLVNAGRFLTRRAGDDLARSTW
jgi:hypothetical protein